MEQLQGISSDLTVLLAHRYALPDTSENMTQAASYFPRVCICVCHFLCLCAYLWWLAHICVDLTEEIPRLIALSCPACINLLNRVNLWSKNTSSTNQCPCTARNPTPHHRSVTKGPTCKVNRTIITANWSENVTHGFFTRNEKSMVMSAHLWERT